MLKSEIDKMDELDSQVLLGIDIRSQDKGKKFVAYPEDIEETPDEGTGVEYSYAIK